MTEIRKAKIPAKARKDLMRHMSSLQWNLLASAFDNATVPSKMVEDACAVKEFLRGLVQDDGFQRQLATEMQSRGIIPGGGAPQPEPPAEPPKNGKQRQPKGAARKKRKRASARK